MIGFLFQEALVNTALFNSSVENQMTALADVVRKLVESSVKVAVQTLRKVNVTNVTSWDRGVDDIFAEMDASGLPVRSIELGGPIDPNIKDGYWSVEHFLNWLNEGSFFYKRCLKMSGNKRKETLGLSRSVFHGASRG